MRHRTPHNSAGRHRCKHDSPSLTEVMILGRAVSNENHHQAYEPKADQKYSPVAHIKAKKPTLGPNICGHALSLLSSKEIHPYFDAMNCSLGIDFVYLYAPR
jgi:hypothetical protein